VDDDRQPIGNNRYLGGVTLNFVGASQCLIKGFGILHMHVGYYFRLHQIGNHNHVVLIQDAREYLGLALVGDRMSAVFRHSRH
jgi:hypothetical protein